MLVRGLFVLSSIVLLNSCAFRDNPKYGFSNGIYNSRIIGKDVKKVYVENNEQTIRVYPLVKSNNQYVVDSIRHRIVVFDEMESDSLSKKTSFVKTSFDIDFVTIPFKFRPAQQAVPKQFNANLNGGVFVGYRSDVYVLNYTRTPLGVFDRHTTHFGFSLGGFAGLGGTAMNPWMTNNSINIEYDGIVWTRGIAGIVGLNNFTAGIALGWDYLLDKNKVYWIYHNKAWIGIVFGLNLN